MRPFLFHSKSPFFSHLYLLHNSRCGSLYYTCKRFLVVSRMYLVCACITQHGEICFIFEPRNDFFLIKCWRAHLHLGRLWRAPTVFFGIFTTKNQVPHFNIRWKKAKNSFNKNMIAKQVCVRKLIHCYRSVINHKIKRDDAVWPVRPPNWCEIGDRKKNLNSFNNAEVCSFLFTCPSCRPCRGGSDTYIRRGGHRWAAAAICDDRHVPIVGEGTKRDPRTGSLLYSPFYLQFSVRAVTGSL